MLVFNIIGTTTNTKALIGFKQGAFVAKLPVQPVLIRYKNKLVGETHTLLEYCWLMCIFNCRVLIAQMQAKNIAFVLSIVGKMCITIVPQMEAAATVDLMCMSALAVVRGWLLS